MAQLFNRVFLNRRKCLSHMNYVVIRCKNNGTNLSFDTVQKERRSQALRSVLFTHKSSKDYLLRFCSNYGRIGSAFFFKKTDNGFGSIQYALIEFAQMNSVKKLVDNAKHFPNQNRIPLGSHCLYLNYNSKRQHLSNSIHHISKYETDNIGSTDLCDQHLVSCSSVDQQMELLYKKQSLNELEIRLRYFIAAEVENLFKKLFPQSESQMFGSTATGLGRYNGDVDITLDIEPDHLPTSDGVTEFNTAYFISKMRPESDRHFCQGLLESFGSTMKHFMPQMINVRPILRARVPIVKFKHSSTDIKGDLCIGNKEAIKMAQILYHVLHHHDSVLPLVFTIRQWAKCEEVTRSSPGPWLSNFMLTLLVVFYLQSHPKILLPAIKDIEHAQRVDSGTIDTISKESLLLEFFKFYAEVDFTKNGISVFEGTFVPKPEIKAEDNSDAAKTEALYLENPIERHLNVAKIVLEPDLLHFQKSCSEAYDLLSNSPRPHPANQWGLLSILTTDNVDTCDEIDVSEHVAVQTDDKISI